jgi:uncharacterized protein with HEPN domain
MPEGRERAYLTDILEAVSRIFRYTEGMTSAAFFEDTKTQDAVVRNLEVIGEATKALSEEIRVLAEHIPWKSIAGMRDKLIHHYFGVNLDIVWGVVKEDLPPLDVAVRGMLSSLDEVDPQRSDG